MDRDLSTHAPLEGARLFEPVAMRPLRFDPRYRAPARRRPAGALAGVVIVMLAAAALAGTALSVTARHPGARSLEAGAVAVAGEPASPPPATRPGHRPRPRPFPSVRAMERAAAYIQTRAGEASFAVVDSAGHEYGLDMHRTFVSASVVKAMLLVAYLRALGRQDGALGAESETVLTPMIHVSDNAAASAVWERVGAAGLQDVARAAGMKEFGLISDWANEQISAADQARFFFGMDALIPPRFRAYARALLSGVDASQSWGIPAVTPAGWRVFFKGGWRLTGTGQLVSQVGRLERRGRRLAIAVMTDEDPSMAYGESTIEGVTSRLLSG